MTRPLRRMSALPRSMSVLCGFSPQGVTWQNPAPRMKGSTNGATPSASCRSSSKANGRDVRPFALLEDLQLADGVAPFVDPFILGAGFCQVTPCGKNPHKTDIDRGNADIRRNGLVIGRRDYVGPVLRVTRDLDGEVEGKLHPPGILHPPIDSNAADLARFAQVDCQPRRIGRGGGPAG